MLFNKTPEQKALDDAIKALDHLKAICPNTEITIETDHGTVSCKIGDANIYDDAHGDLCIDAE